MKHLLIILSLSLAIAACSKDDQKSDPSGVSTSEATETYHFRVNNCDTGRQDFKAVSADAARKALCEGLQNTDLNRSCAEGLREQFFLKKCFGQKWNPRSFNVTTTVPAPVRTTTTPQPFFPRTSGLSFQQEQKIRDSLNYMLAEAYQVDAALSKEQLREVMLFAGDLMSCGFSYQGTNCFDHVTYTLNYGAALNEVDGKYVFQSEQRLRSTSTSIFFIFTLEQVDPVVKIKKLEILKGLKPRSNMTVSEFLKDKTNATGLMTVKLANDVQTLAWKRIESPDDVRMLYHMSRLLLELNKNNAPQGKQKLAAILPKQAKLIAQSEQTQYQERILSLIKDELPVKTSDLIEVCDGLLKSKSSAIQQRAASIILEADSERTDVKPLVIKALNADGWQTRVAAVKALTKVSKTTAEENQLLMKVTDEDADVQTAAIVAAGKINLTNEHLQTAKQVAHNNAWKARVQGVKLLGRINSESSTKELINKLSDEDVDVRTAVTEQLQSRKLSEDNVQGLTGQLKASDWKVRKEAARFLGKVDGVNATNVLATQLKDEDVDVRTMIATQLTSRNLTDASVPALNGNLQSGDWKVRVEAAKVLGKIKSRVALDALQERLMKEDDVDVKSAIVASIRAIKA